MLKETIKKLDQNSESKKRKSLKDLKEDYENFRRWREARELEIAKLPCVFCHKVLDCSVECMEKNEMIRIGKEQGKDINQIASEIWKMKRSSRQEILLCEDEEASSDEEEESPVIAELECDSEMIGSTVLKKTNEGNIYTQPPPLLSSPPSPPSPVSSPLPPPSQPPSPPSVVHQKKKIEKALEEEKESEITPQLLPPPFPVSSPIPPTLASLSSPPPSRPPSPPSLGFENKNGDSNGDSILKMRSLNRWERKLEGHLFDDYKPPPPPPPPPLSESQSKDGGEHCLAVHLIGVQTEGQGSAIEVTAPLEALILGHPKYGPKNDNRAEIGLLGSQNWDQLMAFNKNGDKLSPIKIKSLGLANWDKKMDKEKVSPLGIESTPIRNSTSPLLFSYPNDGDPSGCDHRSSFMVYSPDLRSTNEYFGSQATNKSLYTPTGLQVTSLNFHSTCLILNSRYGAEVYRQEHDFNHHLIVLIICTTTCPLFNKWHNFKKVLKGWNRNMLDRIEVRVNAECKVEIRLPVLNMVLDSQLRVVYPLILKFAVSGEWESNSIIYPKLFKSKGKLKFEDGVVNLVATFLWPESEELKGELHSFLFILIRHYDYKGEYHKFSETTYKNLKLETQESQKRARVVEILQYHSINGEDGLFNWRYYEPHMLRRRYVQEKEIRKTLKIVTGRRNSTQDKFIGRRELRTSFENTDQTIELPPPIVDEFKLIIEPETKEGVRMNKGSKLDKREVLIQWQGLTKTEAPELDKVKRGRDVEIQNVSRPNSGNVGHSCNVETTVGTNKADDEVVLMILDTLKHATGVIMLIADGKEFQEERETKLITILKNRLQPFVKGQTTEFVNWATSEAYQLSQARFGVAMLHTIGYIYTRQAARELGKDKPYMVPILPEFVWNIGHWIKSQVIAISGEVLIKKIQEEVEKLNNSEWKEEEIMIGVEEKKDQLVTYLWDINVADIETTLSRVCQAVLKDPTVSKDELKQRAIGMKKLGEIFQGPKKHEGAQV